MSLNCNVLALDERIVLSAARNVDVKRRLKALGLEVFEVLFGELLRGGGGPRCMSFPIERDT